MAVRPALQNDTREQCLPCETKRRERSHGSTAPRGRERRLKMNTSSKNAINIEYIEIGNLKPDPANPRRISEQELEALTRSIREFGLIDPIIARNEDRTVIGGHQRLLAARRPGYKTGPGVFVGPSLEQ